MNNQVQGAPRPKYVVKLKSGIYVGIHNNAEAGFDTSGGDWSLSCESHRCISPAFQTMDDVLAIMTHPEEWCDVCAGMADSRERPNAHVEGDTEESDDLTDPRGMLERAMADCANWVQRIAAEEELFAPHLLLCRPDGTRELVALRVRGEVLPDAIRLQIFDNGATVAVLATETYASLVSPDDPRAQALMTGRLRVSDLPPADRSDRLMLYGEVAPSGAGDRWLYRQYRIEPGGTPMAPRTFVEQPIDSARLVKSRFQPMFVGRSQIEAIKARLRRHSGGARGGTHSAS